MDNKSTILFFGDTSLPITSALSRLLQSQRKHTLLSKFLSLAQNELQNGIRDLPWSTRKDALRFTELFDFVDPVNSKNRSLRVLSPALLVIVQLGHCIALVVFFFFFFFFQNGFIQCVKTKPRTDGTRHIRILNFPDRTKQFMLVSVSDNYRLQR